MLIKPRSSLVCICFIMWLLMRGLENFSIACKVSLMRVHLMIVVSQSNTFVINHLKRCPTFCLASFAIVQSWLNSKLHISQKISDAPN